MGRQTRTGVASGTGKVCGLLIRRPQVRTLLGPLSDAKQKKIQKFAAGLAASRITLAAARAAFGVSL